MQTNIIPLPRNRDGIRRFLAVSHRIYAQDPLWVAPLQADMEKVFQDVNPFFRHAEMQLWIAQQGSQDIGRIAGILDRTHNQVHNDAVAFFGFFECVNHPAIARQLFDAVISWAGTIGAHRLLGPMNPSTNDECGLLVDGFAHSPVFMMTYNPPYYPDLLEAVGFTRTKDLLAFLFDLTNTPMERFERLFAKFRKREPEIEIIPIRRKSLRCQLEQIREVYNSAWSQNWGFVPMTKEEIGFMADRLAPLLVEGLAFLAKKAHKPIGFLLALPDFNEAFRALKGRFLSPGLFSAVPYLLRWRYPAIVRVIALGVNADCRGQGIEAAMLTEGLRTGFRLGFRKVESSWILEDNQAVQRLIQLFGGRPYKTYRIYEKPVP